MLQKSLDLNNEYAKQPRDMHEGPGVASLWNARV